MIKTRIIPVLLLKGHSVVKTIQFNEARIVGDAVATVKVFSARKADEMIIVDIDASRAGSLDINLIERIAKSCTMPLSVGGGIKSLEDADRLFRVGADKIVINSLFYSDKKIMKKISQKYGEQAIVFSLDVKNINGDNQAVFNGSSQDSGMSAINAAKEAVAYGAGEIYLNSVEQDGCMNGYDLELVKHISNAVNVPVIAAGGCGSVRDCVNVIKSGADAVAASSIFFWKGESIITIKQELKNNGIEVRLI